MERRPGQLISSLIVLAATWWVMQPEHRRQEIRMRAALRFRTRVHSLARGIGARGMSQELQGDPEAAADAYDTAHHLMTTWYERASRWYDRAAGGAR